MEWNSHHVGAVVVPKSKNNLRRLSLVVPILFLTFSGVNVPSSARVSKNVEIELGKFSRLKPPLTDFSGAVAIRFENKGRATTTIPFSWITLPADRDSSTSVILPDTEVWCVASTIKYSWTDELGRKIIEGETPIYSEWLTLKKCDSAMKNVLIRIPDKPGKYIFNLTFDNSVVNDYGSDKSSYNSNLYSTFKAVVERVVEVK